MVTTPEEEEERPAPAEPTRPESPAQPLSPPYSAAEDQELDEDQQELQRLREELAALQQQFESPGRRQRQITVLRQVVAEVLVFVAALQLHNDSYVRSPDPRPLTYQLAQA